MKFPSEISRFLIVKECLEILKEHWLKYKSLLSPRIHFFVNDCDIYMEELAEEMYDLYNLEI